MMLFKLVCFQLIPPSPEEYSRNGTVYNLASLLSNGQLAKILTLYMRVFHHEEDGPL